MQGMLLLILKPCLHIECGLFSAMLGRNAGKRTGAELQVPNSAWVVTEGRRQIERKQWSEEKPNECDATVYNISDIVRKQIFKKSLRKTSDSASSLRNW